ncbi:MAG: pyruvate dehydrogenase (acetyl-transferring), homodimeric type, partial [Lentisphaeria bacterium]|nr:pyruvate dehydrogenase (acetyl-transferring), homodimeric type [Lentisphaeria bacterium]
EDVFYYITLGNENYPQPALPDHARDGIVRGLYRLEGDETADVQLLGSGAILRSAIQARKQLEDSFGIRAAVWSVTSYGELYRDACRTERWNRLHPGKEPRVPYLRHCLGPTRGPIVAATDYVRALPASVAPWLESRLQALGTDGFGRSDGREALRRFFGVDASSMVFAALTALAARGAFEPGRLEEAAEVLAVDRDPRDPMDR